VIPRAFAQPVADVFVKAGSLLDVYGTKWPMIPETLRRRQLPYRIASRYTAAGSADRRGLIGNRSNTTSAGNPSMQPR
jgi:hypothetical protein